jgi:hypothetical protein
LKNSKNDSNEIKIDKIYFSSTPSLPEATTEAAKPLMESFEQTVSADNLSAKQASPTIFV